MNDKPSLEEALAHFGVKVMKWGVRKKGKVSLAQNVKLNVAARREFNQQKQNKLVEKAKTGDYTIEAAFKGELSAKILTGKQFVDRMSKGDKLNVTMSDLHSGRVKAHPNDRGPIFLQLQDHSKIGNYKIKNFNKK